MRLSINSSVVLWVVQGFLALFIGVASGLPKLILPLDMLAMPLPLPELFVRSIGVAEVLGALGLILPSVFRIRPMLTPLAAFGVVLLTICATVYQLIAGQPESAIFASVMGLIAASVAYGRWRIAPIRQASSQSLVEAAV